MRNFFTAFIVFLAWFGLAFLYASFDFKPTTNSFFNSNQKEKEEITVQDETVVSSNIVVESHNAKLQVFDENNHILFSLDSVYFEKNNENVVMNTSVNFFSELKAYLSLNDKSIEIISHYSAEENYSSPSLGIKRGKSLEKLLIDAGVRINEIKVKGVLSEIGFDQNNKSFGNLHLILREQVQQPDTALPNELNINIYPGFTFAEILVNNELKEYGRKLKEYLQQHPNRNVQIIGHTDNVGSHADTYELGLKYARQVRAYLINIQRIEAGRLVAKSLGKENPIADNGTEEGRRKNLRIEFKIE